MDECLQQPVVEYHCPECNRWSEWTDGIEGCDDDEDAGDEFWCQTCGAQTPVDSMSSRYQ